MRNSERFPQTGCVRDGGEPDVFELLREFDGYVFARAALIDRTVAVQEMKLAAYLAPKVPRYKMPKRFFFWEALPKSGYGKVPKRLIRDELEARGLLEAIAKSPGA